VLWEAGGNAMRGDETAKGLSGVLALSRCVGYRRIATGWFIPPIYITLM
jgi:hypothetical protein